MTKSMLTLRISNSPEPKIQVSFSDHNLSIVVVVVNFSPWVKEIQVCSNEGSRPFPRGDNSENTLTIFKKSPPPELLAQFQ